MLGLIGTACRLGQEAGWLSAHLLHATRYASPTTFLEVGGNTVMSFFVECVIQIAFQREVEPPCLKTAIVNKVLY